MSVTRTHDMADHLGNRLVHGRPEVNGVQIHYAIGGSGDPVILLHGVPKTMYYWHKVIPLLTPHHTVVALDCRGFGDSERSVGGYDTHRLDAGPVEGRDGVGGAPAPVLSHHAEAFESQHVTVTPPSERSGLASTGSAQLVRQRASLGHSGLDNQLSTKRPVASYPSSHGH